jgi:hypothetical protein
MSDESALIAAQTEYGRDIAQSQFLLHVWQSEEVNSDRHWYGEVVDMRTGVTLTCSHWREMVGLLALLLGARFPESVDEENK